MKPALELGTTPGHGYSLHAVLPFFGSVLQNPDFSRQTPWFFANLSCFSCVCTRSSRSLSISLSLSLSRRAAPFTVFVHFLLRGTWPESCLGATSVSKETFKSCQKFVDHRRRYSFSVNIVRSNMLSFAEMIENKMGGHIRCMHARRHRHKGQLQLRSLRDLRSCKVFTLVRQGIFYIYTNSNLAPICGHCLSHVKQ